MKIERGKFILFLVVLSPQVKTWYQDGKIVNCDSSFLRIFDIFDSLPYREKEILKLRFGLDNQKPKTLDEVGKIFGVTRERIRQIEAKSIRTLKRQLFKSFLDSSRVKRNEERKTVGQ